MKFIISPLIIPMILVLYFCNNLYSYAIAYVIMIIHEFAHLCVALCIGLSPESISFLPFGVNLKLKNKIHCTLSEDIILYGIGPLVNAILALVGIFSGDVLFYKLNISLFVLNILPILPLDGGMIAMRILSYFYGQRFAKSILNGISWCISLIVILISSVMLFYHNINITLYVISMLLIGNIITSKEKFEIDMIYSFSFSKKRTNKVKFYIINNNQDLIHIIKSFSPAYTTLGVVLNDNGEVSKLVSEKEIFNIYNNELMI